MSHLVRAIAAACLLAPALPARAHHGVAAVGVAGPEGPGAALETTSPLPLPQGTLFAMAKTEYVPYQQRDLAEPTNKAFASFSMLGAGYGIAPWLSAYVFQPYAVKSQDGVGTNAGAGDTSLMLSLGLKWDEGLGLVPEKESLDDLMDWHLGLWASCTVPVGPTTARDDAGAYFEPDMQTGFGAPSPAAGVAVMKQLTEDVTWLAEVSYQHFVAHTYPFTRYQFGDETRVNTAATWRVHASGRFRLDVAAELNALHLQRDRERDEVGDLQALRASGGAILYAGGGVRAYLGAWTLGAGVRRAAWKDLNEEAEQQGSEGLERFRATFTLSYATRL